MIFYLGTHQPAWLGRIAHPLFVSRRRLAGRETLPRARGTWVLDSGGFTEVSMFGGWKTSAETYALEVRRYRDEIGGLQWAPIQDWMCEPPVIAGRIRRRNPRAKRKSPIDLQAWLTWARAAGPVLQAAVAKAEELGEEAEVEFHGTGLSVVEHQRRSCASYDELLRLAPDLPWTPVLQGWEQADYLRHLAMYQERGHDLRRLPIVGVGSVCRRQATGEAGGIVRALAGQGLRLHGFGFKIEAFEAGYHRYLESADSLAWSYASRRSARRPECVGHKNCANCPRSALDYRDRVAALVNAVPPQMEMFS